MQLEENLATFNKLRVKQFSPDMEIGVGALVCLTTAKNEQKHFFISPVAGGISLHYQNMFIMLITPSSPLGVALINSSIGDDVHLNDTSYNITHIC